MKKTIAVLPGDGVGPEVIEQAIRVLKKIEDIYHHTFMFAYGLIGAAAIDRMSNPLPEETVALCKESDAILFGAIGDPKYDLDPLAKVRPEQGLLRLRQSLGLFANIRPVKIYPELIDASPLKKEKVANIDLLVVRELTSGIYFGEPRQRRDNGNTAIDTSVYTKEEILRVAKIAFDLARERKKKVTSVDKANVLETSRLWRETVTDVAKEYSDVILTHMFVDNAAMQLIKRPSDFDVILTENMFGDILTDEASVLVGSIGLLPSASLGKKYSLFEPIHGSYHKNTGKNIANPIATILSASMMLRTTLGLPKEAQVVENAISQVIHEGIRTKDIAIDNTPDNQIVGTREMGDCILVYI